MNSSTRIQQLQNMISANKIPLATIIGHGTLLQSNSLFRVPDDKFVIFISRPGYYIALRLLKESRMMSLMQSKTKLRQLLTDRLPAENTPRIITGSHWNWKRHIYGPGQPAPNMGLELYDNSDSSWGRWYNSLCGWKFVGEPFLYRTYGQRMNSLQQLLMDIKGPAVVFVFGCRGDPNTAEGTARAFQKHGRFGRRQNYRLPPSSLVSATRAHEEGIARYHTKRVRGFGLSLRKEKVEPSAKRRRMNATVLKIARNIKTNRFVKSHHRANMNNTALANAKKRKRNANGLNYTNAEIANAIRRLKI
jgi:hypothetical protein